MTESWQDLMILISFVLSLWSFIWLWAKISRKDEENFERRLSKLEGKNRVTFGGKGI